MSAEFSHTILTMMLKESCLVSSAVRDRQKCVSKSVSRASARVAGTYIGDSRTDVQYTSAGLERRGQYHHSAKSKTALFQTKLMRVSGRFSQVSHGAVGDVASRTDDNVVGDVRAVHLLLHHHHTPTTPRRRRTKIAAKRLGRHRRRAAILHIPIAP